MKSNRLILKSQQRFRSEKHNVFTEKVNKIALSTNHDKRIQSIDSMEKYIYGTSKDLARKKEEIEYNYINKAIPKLINFDYIKKENIKEHNPKKHCRKFLIIPKDY